MSKAKASTHVFSIAAVAAICHAANKQLCFNLGDDSQQMWNGAHQWQKDSAIKGVAFCLKNPKAPASANHESWLKQKEADGWVYGEEKDADAKTHPCMVPFAKLPPEQQAKDHLFRGIVEGLRDFIDTEGFDFDTFLAEPQSTPKPEPKKAPAKKAPAKKPAKKK